MQVNFSTHTPQELKALARFIAELAVIREGIVPAAQGQETTTTPATAASNPEPGAEQNEATAPKRTRKGKTESTTGSAAQAQETTTTQADPASRPSTPEGSDKPLTAGEAVEALKGHANKPDAEGNGSPAATQTAGATTASTESAAESPSSEKAPVTHDALRQLMGEISQVSMTHRSAAIALVRSTAGCNGIGDIKAEFLDSIHAGFLSILAEAKAAAAQA